MNNNVFFSLLAFLIVVLVILLFSILTRSIADNIFAFIGACCIVGYLCFNFITQIGCARGLQDGYTYPQALINGNSQLVSVFSDEGLADINSEKSVTKLYIGTNPVRGTLFTNKYYYSVKGRVEPTHMNTTSTPTQVYLNNSKSIKIDNVEFSSSLFSRDALNYIESGREIKIDMYYSLDSHGNPDSIFIKSLDFTEN